jgi:deazaflavin-dependent oxidoreductase (nitroreductase family)
MPLDPSLKDEPYCYLTTVGRVTGKAHEIEIWFGLQGDTLYLLSGGGADGKRSDWVLNLSKDPQVSVRLREVTYRALARLVEVPDEDALARRLLFDKYNPSYNGDLTEWRDTALPVALDVQSADSTP